MERRKERTAETFARYSESMNRRFRKNVKKREVPLDPLMGMTYYLIM